MKKAISISKLGFKTAITYRFDFLLHMISSPISLVVFYFLWLAIFQHTGEEVIRGFTFAEMVSYYVINMVITHFIWSDVEMWMEWAVIDGEMVNYFTRPLKLISQLFFFEQGLHSLSFLIESVPVFIIGLVFFGVVLASPINIMLFIVSLMLAVVLFFMLSFLLGLSAFWLNRITGIMKAKYTVFGFLSGGIIPLTFFPSWLQTASAYMPFQSLRFVPISIYLGHYTLLQSLLNIGVQLLWIAVLLLLALVIEKRAFKKFAGAGT
ncbi:MAG: ABC-2 family transporter protein [Candidatus Woesearchaeota archaeon]